KYFGRTLAGRLVLSAGLGGMGGPQPLAVTLNAGAGLLAAFDRERTERRPRLRYADRMTSSLDEALGWAAEARGRGAPRGGTLAGRLVLSAGLGGMGGTQPLAVTLNAGVGLFVEIDRERIERRLRHRYVDRMTSSLDEALGWAEEAREKRAPLSIALHGNAAEVHPELARRGVRFDVVTDQTSAHDMLNGYIPAGLSAQAATRLRARDPKEYLADRKSG